MRPAVAGRLVLGVACLAAPRAVVRRVGRPADETTVVVALARVLGARLALQAVLDLAVGDRTRPWDVTVDLVHAASMVELARRFPDHRRLALASGATAAVIGVVDAVSS